MYNAAAGTSYVGKLSSFSLFFFKKKSANYIMPAQLQQTDFLLIFV